MGVFTPTKTMGEDGGLKLVQVSLISRWRSLIIDKVGSGLRSAWGSVLPRQDVGNILGEGPVWDVKRQALLWVDIEVGTSLAPSPSVVDAVFRSY